MSTARCLLSHPNLEIGRRLEPLPGSSYLNAFAGVLLSQQERAARTHCRFLADTGDIVQGILLPSSIQREIARKEPRVIAVMASEDVVLVAPETWQMNEQWNQWQGRVVFVGSCDGTPTVTVKILGKQWTIRSMGPVIGRECRPKVWDPVIVAIEPEKVLVKHHLTPRPSLRPRLLRVSK